MLLRDGIEVGSWKLEILGGCLKSNPTKRITYKLKVLSLFSPPKSPKGDFRDPLIISLSPLGVRDKIG